MLGFSPGRVGMQSAGGGFGPLSLFASGEQGVWYDPSDLTTLYQDSAGTTPVTAVEQPVGKMLDKSGWGNHALQATAASRPVLSARVNLLTYTEQLDNAAWSKQNTSVTANATTAPDGTLTADLVTSSNISCNVRQTTATIAAGTSYQTSVALKRSDNDWVQLYHSDGVTNAFWYYVNLATGAIGNFGSVGTVSNTSSSITDLGNGWYRVTLTGILSTSTNGGPLIFPCSGNGGAGVSGKSLYVWGADLRATNDGVAIPVYQRVDAPTSYDTTGFPMYLRFDGVDDSLATGSIDFSAADKLSVFAGVRKLSDAADGYIVGLSPPGSNGIFDIRAPGSSGTTKYQATAKGTLAVFPYTSSATYAAPHTAALTFLQDIGADIAKLRLNGAEVASVTSDQGTGTLANLPLYIGRLNGTTLPFNGRLHSLIVRGAASSGSQITSAETWINDKTRAY